MYRTLFYIPREMGDTGIPVFGFGLVLAVWILFSVILLAWLVRQQGFNADTWGYVGLLGLIAAIVSWVLPAVGDQQGLPIRGYGVMFLLAVVTATLLATWRARRVGLDPDLIFSLAFWMFVPGIIGARLFYVIEYWDQKFWPVFLEKGFRVLLGAMVNVTEGGLVAYGGFIGSVLGLLLFARKFRLPLLATVDLIAPSIMLGLALGRIGCLLNGCCWGGVCERPYPWLVEFPAGSPPYAAQVMRGQRYGFTLSGDPDAALKVLSVDPHSPAEHRGLSKGDRILRIDGKMVQSTGHVHDILLALFEKNRPVLLEVEGKDPIRLKAVPIPSRSLPVHPTQIYSSINALLLCLLLLAYDPFRRRDGELFAVLISIYPIARFLLEIIRVDESGALGTVLSISQNVSLALLVCAAALWFYVLRQPRGKAFG